MGTRNNPGRFDCASRAEPDEPTFTLLGRDPAASVVVRVWHDIRRDLGRTESEVLDEAMECARAMAEWSEELGKDPYAAVDVYQKQLRDSLRVRRAVEYDLSGDRMLRWFAFGHLPSNLQEVSRPFCDLALQIVASLDPGPERTVALRKLLEAKDAAVRAALVPGG